MTVSFQLLVFRPEAQENAQILELVGQHMGWDRPPEIEPDQAVTITMQAEDLESGQERIRAALDAAERKLKPDWNEYFRFAEVPP